MLSQLLAEKDYPDELVNLYNPAFAGAIIFVAGSAFEKEASRSFPFVFTYVAMTLTSIDEFRFRLPSRAIGRFSDWAQSNADVIIRFPPRVVSLKRFVDSGLVFLGSKQLMTFDSQGCRFSNHAGTGKKLTHANLSCRQVEDELRAAALLGRWLAKEPDIATVLAFLGVKP